MAMENAGLDAVPSGWIASCDARLFSRIGGMDTIVFGPGDLASAHAHGESLALSEMEAAARVLVRFILDWCR
jgi:acetylornithine deacetylase/succinyl-diaminopimelate desuccinylase-like protein